MLSSLREHLLHILGPTAIIALGRFKNALLAAYTNVARPVVDIAGVKVPMGPHMSEQVQHALMDQTYEIEEFRILQSTLAPDDVVLEVGTGLGFLSTFCSQRVGSEKVFTYEANPCLESHIRKTYRLNQVCPTLTISALAECGGDREFYVCHDMWNSSFVKPAQFKKRVCVKTLAFNAEIRRIVPSYLIVDIEGAELELFRHAELSGVQKILVEIHDQILGANEAQELKQLLFLRGYKLNERQSVGNRCLFELS